MIICPQSAHSKDPAETSLPYGIHFFCTITYLPLKFFKDKSEIHVVKCSAKNFPVRMGVMNIKSWLANWLEMVRKVVRTHL